MTPARKKLIEVALPLDAVNAAARAVILAAYSGSLARSPNSRTFTKFTHDGNEWPTAPSVFALPLPADSPTSPKHPNLHT